MPGRKPTAATLLIPSPSGAEVFGFNQHGRHLQTRDALTGAIRYEFEYNTAGVLTGIRDGSNNLTQFLRNPDGTLDRIIGTFGQSTEVEHNDLNLISEVVAPDASDHEFTYVDSLRFADSALLETFTDPRGATSTFDYNDFGELRRDEDPAGGFTAITRADSSPTEGDTATTVTAQGRLPSTTCAAHGARSPAASRSRTGL